MDNFRRTACITQDQNIPQAGSYYYSDGTFGTETSGKTIIGVVVVPSNCSGDGSTRVMALTDINEKGKPIGSDDWIYMAQATSRFTYWSNMTSYRAFPIAKSGDNYELKYVLQENDRTPPYTLTADVGHCVASSYANKLIGDMYYYMDLNAYDYLETSSYPRVRIVSPYLKDGSPNQAYRTAGTATSDFDGYANTQKKKTNTLNAAAIACTKYSPSASTSRKWYLPSLGELAFVAPKSVEIKQALDNCGGYDLKSGSYWTSTQSRTNGDYKYGYIYHNGAGYIMTNDYTSSNLVRPFIKVN